MSIYGVIPLRAASGKAEGYARRTLTGCRIEARGLPPGCESAILLFHEDGDRVLYRGRSDGEGRLSAESSAFTEGELAIVCGAPPLLMCHSAGIPAAEARLRARKLLSPPPAVKVEPPAKREEEAKASVKDEPAPNWTLRTESDAPPVDALPKILWPEELAPYRELFEQDEADAPFRAPGCRFTRVPSGNPKAPFIYLGVKKTNGAVASAVWALPARFSVRPPEGFTFLPAVGGGYWIKWNHFTR